MTGAGRLLGFHGWNIITFPTPACLGQVQGFSPACTAAPVLAWYLHTPLA